MMLAAEMLRLIRQMPTLLLTNFGLTIEGTDPVSFTDSDTVNKLSGVSCSTSCSLWPNGAR